MVPVYPGRRVRLECTPQDKAPKRVYGEGVYRFAASVAALLKRRGWAEVKRTRGGTFLRRPDDAAGPPFFIDATLPTQEQMMALAAAAHRAGVPSVEKVGEWLGVYYPASSWTDTEVDFFTGEAGEARRGGAIPAHFEVGTLHLWNAAVVWDGGEPAYFEMDENVVPAGAVQQDLFSGCEASEREHYEGALRRAEQNVYERDRDARTACVAHHGAACVACLFDFAKTYGEAAAGFIHVHHLVPLSQVGGEYRVDPIRDLVPVCPNCHAVMHLREPPYTPDEVRGLIAASAAAPRDRR